MIYINNSTEFIEIPRFSAKLGDRLVLINQITKVEISINFEDDGLGSYYRIPVGDIIGRFETGQYDYYLYGGDFDLGKGILQFDDFSKKVVEYNDDIEVIQYTPDMEYTPVPDRVLKIEKNGVYDTKLYDKADVDVLPEPAILPNNTKFKGSNQTECPSFDYRNITDAYELFSSNSKLVKIGEMLNTGNITRTNEMFTNCKSLTSIPKMDTSNVTDMNIMFNSCYKITSVPQMDTSKVTRMSQTFINCYSLTSVPKMDTSNVTDMNYMVGWCSSLTTIPQLDTSKVTTMIGTFQSSEKITDLGGFTNLGKAFTNSQNVNISYSPLLTNKSVQNIIDTVFDMNLNTKGGSATLKLSQSVINSMSDAQKSQLAAKGWTLTN